MVPKQGQSHRGGRGDKKGNHKTGMIGANEKRGQKCGGWDEDNSLAALSSPEAARKIPTMREENNQRAMTSDSIKHGSWGDKQDSSDDLDSSDDDNVTLEKQELKHSREENNMLLLQIRNYKGDNQQLQKQVHKLKQDNQELNDRVKKLEEERQQYLQESAATEVLVSET